MKSLKIIITVLSILIIGCNNYILNPSIIYDQSKLCVRAQKYYDEFDNYTDWRISIGAIEVLKRVMPSGENMTYMYLIANSSTCVFDGKGIIILFTDGMRFTSDCVVNVEVDPMGNGFKYTSVITLSDADIELFENKQISKYRLYIFDHTPSDLNAKLLHELIKCLDSKGYEK